MGDILLGLPVIIVAAIIGSIIGILLLPAGQRGDVFDPDVITPAAVVSMGLVGQLAGEGFWPLIVARWKGRGAFRDFGFAIEPIDLAFGFGAAIIAVLGAGIMRVLSSLAVGIDLDAEESGNTGVLTDYEGTLWVSVIVAGAVVGAPLAEELFFRGLVQHSIEKRFGTYWAVAGSTVIFVLPHFTNPSLKGTVVLFSSIGVVGAVLGALVAYVRRLGPAIVAHMLFNLLGTVVALSTDSDSAAAIFALRM
jgi:membrane protease YdiL (CAAX protease family)